MKTHNVATFVIAHDRRKILHLHVTRNPMLFELYSKYTKQGPTNSREILAIRPRRKFAVDVVSAATDIGSQQLARPFAVRGRTVLRNARLEVVGVSCFWISSTTEPQAQINPFVPDGCAT